MADVVDSKSTAERRGGSTPSIPTKFHMSNKDDNERFNNLIMTGAYATNEELGSFMGIVIVIGLISAIGYGIYWLVKHF